jgi:pilus assembly protein Flp/PilA
MKQLLISLVRDDQGQDLIEYALLAGFISLAAVAAITLIGTNLNTLYGTVNTKITAANAS